MELKLNPELPRINRIQIGGKTYPQGESFTVDEETAKKLLDSKRGDRPLVVPAVKKRGGGE